ncbi:thioredoxin family protein [Marinagarivorans cellulosilyticus]|uniref:Thioredoxin n=1 Tax=Marinagarivorans cellulosilyticus TaxID=2721545 RepID=A0AAN2BJ27_9GAMM|nr:thioredoxin domain-containing protein [Marinagarivorans cellulosilyticus]BCD96481.1 thioredoxin 1 [Marinagarivorans cellulosilyticus]
MNELTKTVVAPLKTLLESDKTQLLSFSAQWCGPCKTTKPVIDTIANHYQKKVETVRIDVDRHPDWVRHFQVRSVPTQILVDKGEVVVRRSGAVTLADLNTWLASNLAAI